MGVRELLKTTLCSLVLTTPLLSSPSFYTFKKIDLNNDGKKEVIQYRMNPSPTVSYTQFSNKNTPHDYTLYIKDGKTKERFGPFVIRNAVTLEPMLFTITDTKNTPRHPLFDEYPDLTFSVNGKTDLFISYDGTKYVMYQIRVIKEEYKR